jgi:peptidoglycan/LPS O-acetylase OafA/YrhL
MSKTRILELDALRGIAALMVVIFHFTCDRGEDSWSFNIGCIGVDLFFMISGFVILMTINSNKNWKEFLLNRFSRLYPTYWVCVSIITLFILLANHYNIVENKKSIFLPMYFANLTMIQPYLNYNTIDGAHGTLTVELLFYFFVFLFFFINKKNWIELSGGLILVLVFCIRFFVDEILSIKKLFEIIESISFLVYFPLFYSGILFYKMKFNKTTITRWILLSFSFMIQLFVFDRLYNNRGYLSFTEYAICLFTIHLLFTLYLFGKLNFIVNKITLWLGSISYTLYLLHKSIGAEIIIPFLTIKMDLNFSLASCITIVIIMFLAYIVMILIEKPSIKYLRNVFYKPNHLQTI